MTSPSRDGIEFLDTFIYHKDGLLHTKPFSKTCDEHAFLVPTSCHPTHTLKNIPYSIAHRLFRISSEKQEYDKSKVEYSGYLKARGYSTSTISDAFNKVESRDRLKLIGYAGENTNDTNISQHTK